jgi:hypothetical protein
MANDVSVSACIKSIGFEIILTYFVEKTVRVKRSSFSYLEDIQKKQKSLMTLTPIEKTRNY